MWVFGYGSLVWKADFPYTHKLIGYIKGYDRRFWQASIDHRGTPEKPGRVVTLVPSSNPEAKVWGITYKVEDSEAIKRLNDREKRFSQVILDFHPVAKLPIEDGDKSLDNESKLPLKIETVTYIGPENGPLFLGNASVDSMVQQIASASGPSGHNSEYIFKLADFMRANLPEVEDEHLFEIENALRIKQREFQ